MDRVLMAGIASRNAAIALLAGTWPRSNWPGPHPHTSPNERSHANEGAYLRTLPRSDRSGVRPAEFVNDLDRVHGRVRKDLEHLRSRVRPENPCGSLEFGRPRVIRAKVVANALTAFERMLRSPKIGRNFVRSVRRAFGQRAFVVRHGAHPLSFVRCHGPMVAARICVRKRWTQVCGKLRTNVRSHALSLYANVRSYRTFAISPPSTPIAVPNFVRLRRNRGTRAGHLEFATSTST